MVLGHAQVNIQCTTPNETTEQNIRLVHKLLEYGDKGVVAHPSEFFAEKVRVYSNKAPYGEEVDLETVNKYDSERVAALLATKYEVVSAYAFDDKIVASCASMERTWANLKGFRLPIKNAPHPSCICTAFAMEKSVKFGVVGQAANPKAAR